MDQLKLMRSSQSSGLNANPEWTGLKIGSLGNEELMNRSVPLKETLESPLLHCVRLARICHL